MKRQQGAATVELAMLVPALMILVATAIPLLKFGMDYMVVSRAVSSGARYASRVDVNARVASSGGLTRRPTAAEVRQVVVNAAAPLALASVTVSPEPSSTLPGGQVFVSASYQASFGPLGAAANSIRSVFFGKPNIFPQSKVITVSSRAREE